MWECPHCGCHNITGDVSFCPQCKVPRDTPASQAAARSEGAPADSGESGQVGDPAGGPSDSPQASLPTVKRAPW